jgi:hypothetical protein
VYRAHDVTLQRDVALSMAWLGIEPWIEPFRADPRYAELVRAVGLTPTPAKAKAGK